MSDDVILVKSIEVIEIDTAGPQGPAGPAGPTGPGGGGGSSLVVRRSTVTSGDLSPQNTGTWQMLTGSPSLAIPAVVGDYVAWDFQSVLWYPQLNYLDLAVLSGGSLVRYMATGTGTPGAEGSPSFYPQPSVYRGYGPVFEFAVQAGDLDGGNVTVVFATKGNGTGTLFADPTYPLRWRVTNYGPVTIL